MSMNASHCRMQQQLHQLISNQLLVSLGSPEECTYAIGNNQAHCKYLKAKLESANKRG